MSTPEIWRSDRTNLFLNRFWFPIILIVGTIGIFAKLFLTWRVLFAIPPILATLFEMTVAELEVRGKNIRYRRWFAWVVIEPADIVAVGRPRGGIASLRLSQSVFPWGKLYFALDSRSNLNPFGPADHPILQALKGATSLTVASTESAQPSLNGLRAYGLAFAFGIAASLVVGYVTPGVQVTPSPGYSGLGDVAMRFWQIIQSWPYGIITVALMAGAIFRKPPRIENLITAGFIGFLLARIAVQAIG